MTYGNLYNYNPKQPAFRQVEMACEHFWNKYDEVPTELRIHPDNMDGLPPVIIADNFVVKVVADKRQGKGAFELVREDEWDWDTVEITYCMFCGKKLEVT